MLKFTLKYHVFAPTCFGPPGPSSGPGGPKHVGANTRYCNVNFNILCD